MQDGVGARRKCPATLQALAIEGPDLAAVARLAEQLAHVWKGCQKLAGSRARANMLLHRELLDVCGPQLLCASLQH